MQYTIPFGQYVRQLEQLYVWSDLANLEVLHVHAADHFLRLLAERIERAILLEVFSQSCFVRVILELVNQFLDCLFADVIVILYR